MIREATGTDIEDIIRMYELGLRELGEEKFEECLMVKKVIDSYQLAPCFLLEKDGIIIGMAGLTVINSPWNGDATLSDYMFYVYPAHRTLTNLSGLVEKSKEFASSVGLPLRLEFATDVDEKIRRRLFKMHDFEVCSVVGMYEEVSNG